MADRAFFNGGPSTPSASTIQALQAFKPDVVLDFICYTPQEAEQVLP